MVLAPKSLRLAILVAIAVATLGPSVDAAGGTPRATGPATPNGKPPAAPPSGGPTNTKPSGVATNPKPSGPATNTKPSGAATTPNAAMCKLPTQGTTGNSTAPGGKPGPGTTPGGGKPAAGKPGTVRGAVRELMNCGNEPRYTFFVQQWLPTVQCTLDGCTVPAPNEVAAWNRQLVVHGLWPQYEAPTPSNEPLGALTPQLAAIWKGIRTASGGADTMPEHEWRSHGRLSGLTPAEYKAEIQRLHALHPTPAFAPFLVENPMLPWDDYKEVLHAQDSGRIAEPKQSVEDMEKKLSGRIAGLKKRWAAQHRSSNGVPSDADIAAMLREPRPYDRVVPGKIMTLATLKQVFGQNRAQSPCLVCKGAKTMTHDSMQIFAEARYCYRIDGDFKAVEAVNWQHPDNVAAETANAANNGQGNQRKQKLDPSKDFCQCPVDLQCSEHYILVPHALNQEQIAMWAPKGRAGGAAAAAPGN